MTACPLKFRGVEYASRSAAANAHGLHRAAVSYRTRHLGETAEEALEALVSSGIGDTTSRRGRCRVGSMTFSSAAAAARHHNLHPSAVAQAMRKNKRMSVGSAIAMLLAAHDRPADGGVK